MGLIYLFIIFFVSNYIAQVNEFTIAYTTSGIFGVRVQRVHHLRKMAYSYKGILHIPSQNILPNISGYCALLNLQN
jgi:hypothetical protein